MSGTHHHRLLILLGFLLPSLLWGQLLGLQVEDTRAQVREAFARDAQGFAWIQQSSHMWVFRSQARRGMTELIFEFSGEQVVGIYFAHQIEADASIDINFFRDFQQACEKDPRWAFSSERSRFYAGILPSTSLLKTYVAQGGSKEQVLYAFEKESHYVQGRWEIWNAPPSP